MTAFLKIEKNDPTPLRAHYEEVAWGTLRTIWQRKWLIAAIVTAGLLFAAIALVLIKPRYTAEATIQPNFVREELTTGTKTQPIAAVDAGALVDGAARVLRSRATASAVVARLELDKDPDFTGESMSWRVLSGLRAALGLEVETPSPRDVAVNQLMRRVKVTNEPRSYLISVAITTGDPERSAKLANAVVLEYLRGQMLRQLADAQAAVERELAQLSSVYGARHPNYTLGRTKLENLQARLAALRDASSDEDAIRRVTGQSFVAAEGVMIPSGPNITLIIGLAVAAALAVGIALALLLGPRRPRARGGLAVVGEQAIIEQVRE